MGTVTLLTSHWNPGLTGASSGGVDSCTCGALERASISPSVFASSLCARAFRSTHPESARGRSTCASSPYSAGGVQSWMDFLMVPV